MAALTSALLCLAALGFLWAPRATSYVGTRGQHFITAFLENGGSAQPNFQLNVLPPPKGPPTTVVVRAQPMGAPPFLRTLSLRPGVTASVRLPGAVELRGSRRAAGSAVRLTASRPVGVTVVNARGRSSLDTALALPRPLLGTQYVVVTPSLQPDDPHAEFAVVAGARPTSLRLTPPVPILLDGTEHPAGQPILVSLEPFQVLQVQSAGDLSGTRVVATLPVALLAGHRCLHAGRQVCGHVSEQLLPQSRWGRVYAVPPFAPAGPGPRDHVYVVAGNPGRLSSWGGGAKRTHTLSPGAVLRLAVGPERPLVLRCSVGLQVLFLAAAAARGGVAYDPFFTLMPSVGAFRRSFELAAQPGFSNVAVLVAREPTVVFLDQRPLSDLHWSLIPAGPESRHPKLSNQGQALAQGFAWTEVAYGPGQGQDAVHRLETRGAPVGVLSFGTADRAGFGTLAVEQLTDESSLVMPPQPPVSCKDHICSNGTMCRLVKHKPECVPSTQAPSGSKTTPRSKIKSQKNSKSVSIPSSKTTAVAKSGSETTGEVEAGLTQVNEPQPNSAAMVQPAHAPAPQPSPAAEPRSTVMFKSKMASWPGPEPLPMATGRLKELVLTEPRFQAETLPGSKMASLDKSDAAAAFSEGQRASTGGTCWALGQPYIYTFDGYSFPVPGGCSYTLSHCPQALPSGLPAFHLWVACSGGGQPLNFVTMRVFGVTFTAVKHEFGFVEVNKQRLWLPATLGDGRLRLYLHGSELWAEAGLERQPPALRLVYDWQHALSLHVADSYRTHVEGLCGNFNQDPADDVGGPNPQAFLHTWALQPPDAPCHTTRAAPCTAPVYPPEAPGPCAILAALNGPFSQCHGLLPPAPFETSCSAWICPGTDNRAALCLALQVYAHSCQRLGVRMDSWRAQAGCSTDGPQTATMSRVAHPEMCVGPQELPAHCPAGRHVPTRLASPQPLSLCAAAQWPWLHRCPLAPGKDFWEGVGYVRGVRAFTHEDSAMLVGTWKPGAAVRAWLSPKHEATCSLLWPTRVLCGNFESSTADDLQLLSPGSYKVPYPCPDHNYPAPTQDMSAAMLCPKHSHYSLCVNPCPAACPGIQEVVQAPTPCTEGCECNEGFFPAGGDCVPSDSCPCFHNGQYFPPGQTILTKNCSFSCTCQLGQGVTCVPFSCSTFEVCSITNGVLGCQLQATLGPALNPVTSTPFFLPGPRPQCPANSHFVPCGSACPATCTNPSAPEHCNHPCAPTCQCLPGHLLLEGQCVPHIHCFCFLYQGRTFWMDNCTQRCHCPALGASVSKAPQCWPARCHGRCQASKGGQQQCLLVQPPPSPTFPSVPEEPLVCTATGDFHFHTFGGTHYEFPGSCVYRLVGLCGTAPADQGSFSVDLTPRVQPTGCTKALTLTACGLRLDMSPRDLNHIRVDGILESLPFFHGSCLRAYRQGYMLCVDTSFGLSLTYDWDSLVRVTLPRPYASPLCGLCSSSGTLPDTWKVAEVPGCSSVCGPLCPSPCPEIQHIRFTGESFCGLLASTKGPLGPCYSVLDPLPFFSDCLEDVCRRSGGHSAVCRALAAYSVACQALGVHLLPWRTSGFCPMQCPPHSHYELCGPCCPTTCAGRQVCEDPGASGRCCEGCVCDAGFVLSGASCVPAAECGCFRWGRYREPGAVWYPEPRCARRCRCHRGGRVSCARRPCGRGRVCGLHRGERRCLPDGRAGCALTGPAHVLAFDGRAFTLPSPASFSAGGCLDVLARTTRPGAWPFSLDVARDATGPVSLHLHLAGHHLQLDRHVTSVITVDGEHCRLPWALPGGQVWATLEGRHVVVHATCGLHLMYDWSSLVYLSVPATFHDRLAGLCGAFGNDVDILELPLDTGSWPKGPVTTPCLLPQPNPDFSISCPPQLTQILKAPKLCGLLQAPDGPFGRCLDQVNPQPFLRICFQDVCQTQDQHLGLCDALTAYTAACQEAGIPVLPWRSPELCPLTCPPQRHYNICTRTCAKGCVLPAAHAQCSTQCYEGCECEPGLIFDGRDCVSQDHCGCFHHGRYIPVGEALILPGCQERCMCWHDQSLQCQPFSCPQDTGCILAGGMWSCEAGEGATCRLMPGGLFTTFDGLSELAPMPVMPYAYDVATLVDSGPEDPDWFHVIADFPSCPGCPAPQPWVIINFRDGCAAVGPNQEIWVNGHQAQLPTTVCRGVVARREEGSGVIIEWTPMLRMLVGPEGAIALRASPTLQGRLRAACGDYNGILVDDLRLPGGLPAASLADVIRACRTQSFNSCTEKPVPLTVS